MRRSRRTPGGGSRIARIRWTTRSRDVTVPVFSAHVLAGNTTSARSTVSVGAVS